MKKNLIIFFDSGDTIVDETTEVRDERGIVVKAELHDGGKDLLLKLHEEGFILALVADGEVESFKNIYSQHGLSDVFDARAVSEAVGIMKPAAEMFQTAFDALHLTEADKKRVVMIGNRYNRDVLGANRYGITSILYNWSKRYENAPATEEEKPDYTVSTKEALYSLLIKLNGELC